MLISEIWEPNLCPEALFPIPTRLIETEQEGTIFLSGFLDHEGRTTLGALLLNGFVPDGKGAFGICATAVEDLPPL